MILKIVSDVASQAVKDAIKEDEAKVGGSGMLDMCHGMRRYRMK